MLCNVKNEEKKKKKWWMNNTTSYIILNIKHTRKGPKRQTFEKSTVESKKEMK